MTLQQLDNWLRTVARAAPPGRLSMLDGCLIAFVIEPCSIAPDEWFVDLLGARGRITTAQGATLAALTAVVARFDAICEGLSVAPHQHAPLFEEADVGLVLPHPWCMGVLKAMRLRFDDWQPLLDLGRIDHGLMLPILLYCTDPLGRPMLGPPRKSPETKVFLQNAYHDIARVIPAIRDIWMPQRVAQAKLQA